MMLPLVLWPVLEFKKTDEVNNLTNFKVNLGKVAQEVLDSMDQKGRVD